MEMREIGSKMKVVAEILTGRLFYVEVEEEATVGELKKEIGKQENLPGDRLILLLDSTNEERCWLDRDETCLRDYGVEDSSHIYIFFQPISASPSTPKNSASSEPSPSADTKDEANDEEPSNEANEPSASLDQRE